MKIFNNLFKKKEPINKELPWIIEGKKVFGLHELKNQTELTKWLRSDGKNLGDTTKLPWCGDYVETAILNSLPDEKFTGALLKNPYWARNWLKFGVKVDPIYGAVIVFSRGTGGHVGFVVGEDETDYYVLGGNQGDTVSISRISKTRFLGCSWPSTYPVENRKLPVMKPDSIPKTTNEF